MLPKCTATGRALTADDDGVLDPSMGTAAEEVTSAHFDLRRVSLWTPGKGKTESLTRHCDLEVAFVLLRGESASTALLTVTRVCTLIHCKDFDEVEILRELDLLSVNCTSCDRISIYRISPEIVHIQHSHRMATCDCVDKRDDIARYKFALTFFKRSDADAFLNTLQEHCDLRIMERCLAVKPDSKREKVARTAKAAPKKEKQAMNKGKAKEW